MSTPAPKRVAPDSMESPEPKRRKHSNTPAMPEAPTTLAELEDAYTQKARRKAAATQKLWEQHTQTMLERFDESLEARIVNIRKEYATRRQHLEHVMAGKEKPCAQAGFNTQHCECVEIAAMRQTLEEMEKTDLAVKEKLKSFASMAFKPPSALFTPPQLHMHATFGDNPRIGGFGCSQPKNMTLTITEKNP